LFAGTSVGRVGTSTNLVIATREANRLCTRLDMDYLFVLAAALTRDPGTGATLTFTAHNSSQSSLGLYRFLCALASAGTMRGRPGTGGPHGQTSSSAAAISSTPIRTRNHTG
jgi:hypothetical protein